MLSLRAVAMPYSGLLRPNQHPTIHAGLVLSWLPPGPPDNTPKPRPLPPSPELRTDSSSRGAPGGSQRGQITSSAPSVGGHRQPYPVPPPLPSPVTGPGETSASSTTSSPPCTRAPKTPSPTSRSTPKSSLRQ